MEVRRMKKEDILKKLKALANDTRGNESERKSAEQMLDKLMKKYDITEKDLEKEDMKERWFYYDNGWEYRLLHQMNYAYLDDRGWRVMKNAKLKGNRGWIFTDMTDAEYLEFQYMYDVLKTDMWRQMNCFYDAFIMKNNIYPNKKIEHDDDYVPPPDTRTNVEKFATAQFYQGIERTNIRKAIGGPSEEQKVPQNDKK